jgi:hypothetical protein
MRWLFIMVAGSVSMTVGAAELESRALTHYIPQDLLQAIVRKEGWSEIVLKPYNGVRKGDIVRVWAGGMIDRGGGNVPGMNVCGPIGGNAADMGADPARLSISTNPKHAYSILFKTDDEVAHACQPTGKPMQIPLKKDGARLWIGFNDEKGAYMDNHLGKGRCHELDPLWVRIEVIRIVVD